MAGVAAIYLPSFFSSGLFNEGMIKEWGFANNISVGNRVSLFKKFVFFFHHALWRERENCVEFLSSPFIWRYHHD
jgi:hypothetical protein